MSKLYCTIAVAKQNDNNWVRSSFIHDKFFRHVCVFGVVFCAPTQTSKVKCYVWRDSLCLDLELATLKALRILVVLAHRSSSFLKLVSLFKRHVALSVCMPLSFGTRSHCLYDIDKFVEASPSKCTIPIEPRRSLLHF